jgi:hypothetical protein
MTTTTAERPEAEAPKPATQTDPAAAAKALAVHWNARAAELWEQMAEAQRRLEALEAEAAQAALDGQPLPSVADAEAALRALKRARQLAMERAAMADEEEQAAKRATAAEAAAALAPKLVAEGAGIDDCLAELGHRLTVLRRIARQHDQLAAEGGMRRRRGAEPVRASELAGAIMHHAPELADILQFPRPSLDSRQPLAVHLARRHGLGPQLEEVKQ